MFFFLFSSRSSALRRFKLLLLFRYNKRIIINIVCSYRAFLINKNRFNRVKSDVFESKSMSTFKNNKKLFVCILKRGKRYKIHKKKGKTVKFNWKLLIAPKKNFIHVEKRWYGDEMGWEGKKITYGNNPAVPLAYTYVTYNP